MLSPALALLLVVSVVGGYADLAALNPCVGKPTGVHPSSEDSLTTAQEVYCEKGGWLLVYSNSNNLDQDKFTGLRRATGRVATPHSRVTSPASGPRDHSEAVGPHVSTWYV